MMKKFLAVVILLFCLFPARLFSQNLFFEKVEDNAGGDVEKQKISIGGQEFDRIRKNPDEKL